MGRPEAGGFHVLLLLLPHVLTLSVIDLLSESLEAEEKRSSYGFSKS